MVGGRWKGTLLIFWESVWLIDSQAEPRRYEITLRQQQVCWNVIFFLKQGRLQRR